MERPHTEARVPTERGCFVASLYGLSQVFRGEARVAAPLRWQGVFDAPMKILLVCLLLISAPCFAQDPTPVPVAPFRYSFQVSYTGTKTHPELAAVIYKALRALPGIGIVDRDPDAILSISENVSGNQYACSLTILTPKTPMLRDQLQGVLDSYEVEQKLKASIGEITDKDSQVEIYSRGMLANQISALPAVYSYGGSLVSINPSAKVALELAVKGLDMGFVEKQRRQYDYNLAHPFVIPPFKRTPIPEHPTATPTRAPLSLALPADTPEPMLGPDFTPPAKR